MIITRNNKRININDSILKGWMSMKDAIIYTGLSVSSLNRATNKGNLRVSKVTGKNLFKKEWIDNYLEGVK